MESHFLADIKNFTFRYGGNNCDPVLQEFSFSLEAGSRTALHGPNGSGKTTLLYLLAQFLSPQHRDAPPFLRDFSIGFVFQDYSKSLLNWFTVRNNLSLGLPNGSNAADVEPRLLEVFNHNPPSWLIGALEKYPYELSGGQRQLVSIIRAVLPKPRVLLLDEPLTSLDSAHKSTAISILNTAIEYGTDTWVVVAHDLDDCLLLSDTIRLTTGPPLELSRKIPVNLPWPRSYQHLSRREAVRAREDVLHGGPLS